MQLKIHLGQFVLRPLWENISHSPTSKHPRVAKMRSAVLSIHHAPSPKGNYCEGWLQCKDQIGDLTVRYW